MKLIFIRHGDPNYNYQEGDPKGTYQSITEAGHREAKALADHIEAYHPDEIYVSPLGRAQETAGYSLEKLGMEAATLDWLREFPVHVDPNLSEEVQEAFRTELEQEDDGTYKTRIPWDMLPSYWTEHPEYMDLEGWRESAIAKCSDMIPVHDHIIEEFDRLLADHGYERERYHYKVRKSNGKTLVFFCHFGLTCILLAHLWNVSPFIVLQNVAAAPTSVTVFASEEREHGLAAFRTLRVGDISHLSLAGLEPSFSARFCERYENKDERH